MSKVELVCVHYDSQSGQHLTRNQITFHRRNKHIDIKYNFFHDMIHVLYVHFTYFDSYLYHPYALFF